jgi:hypothetical protein
VKVGGKVRPRRGDVNGVKGGEGGAGEKGGGVTKTGKIAHYAATPETEFNHSGSARGGVCQGVDGR